MGNTQSQQKDPAYDDERIDEKKAKCIECVKIVPVISINNLEPGDHIVFRNVNYDHHGIITSIKGSGSLEIIEVTNTSAGVSSVEVTNTYAGASSGISSSSLPISAKSKANIQRNTITLNFKEENIALVYYKTRLEKDRTVERAKHYAKENSSFNYHLFSNNCEHFATYCVTGHRFSLQVSKFKLVFGMLLRTGFSGISNEEKRNEVLHERQLICDSCFEHNKHLLNVDVAPIKSAEDVKEGDIVRFSYYHLLHDAVVLENEGLSSNKSAVILSIAHYAFCGINEHRTIKREKKEFRLDGSCVNVLYTSSKFSLYHPTFVVKRAEDRIGEQFFVFFSNDSSHFARWCKLRFIPEIKND